jgi:dihydroorotate dehydrogenase
VVNVSSPNTPNLRELQDKKPLTQLLSRLQKLNFERPTPKPILLKIAPDLNENQLNDIVEIVKSTQIAGVVATNTTLGRDNLKTEKSVVESIGAGGLSGRVIVEKSQDICEKLRYELGEKSVIIGVGGIDSAETAAARFSGGADLIQIYSAFIFKGPNLIKQILKKI